VEDPILFVNMIRELQKVSSRFDLIDPISKCTRDITVDEDRSKLTCSNMRCNLCA
jgi:hypothetical protein